MQISSLWEVTPCGGRLHNDIILDQAEQARTLALVECMNVHWLQIDFNISLLPFLCFSHIWVLLQYAQS